MATGPDKARERTGATRVLLVEDDQMLRDLLARRLERAGLEIVEVGSGEEALEVIREQSLDVVVSDVLLPQMSGIELLEHIRETHDPAQLPVIITTSLHDSGMIVQAMANGANDFLSKPIDLSAAIARIRSQARLKLIADENRRLVTQLTDANRRLEESNLQLIRMNIELEVEAEGERARGQPPRGRLSAIARLGHETSKWVDQDIVLQRLVHEGAAALGATRACYLQLEGSILRPICWHPAETHAGNSNEAASTDSLVAQATSASGPIIGPAMSGEPGGLSGAIAACPIFDSTGNPEGVLAFSRPDEVAFDSADREVLRSIAAVCSNNLQRTSLTRSNITRMIRMAGLRDPSETAAHAQRVAGIAVAVYDAWSVAQGVPLSEWHAMRDMLHAGALVHDVGKVAVPDEILKKPGRLTTSEFDTMKRHTTVGAELFADSGGPFDRVARDIALCHHERWDGAGYPGRAMPDGSQRGRVGLEIPLAARLVALADVYDALSSVRRYKEAWPELEVLALLKAESGGHFDPEIVSAALSVSGILRRILLAFPETQ